jgi:hypothetical protein
MARDDAEHISGETNVLRLTRRLLKQLREGRTIHTIAKGPNAVHQMVTVSARVQEPLARNGIRIYWRIFFSGPQDSSVTMESYVGGN